MVSKAGAWLSVHWTERWPILGGAGEGQKAFCSGGDQSVRGQGGYVGADQLPRLNVLDLQVLLTPHLPHCAAHQPCSHVWQLAGADTTIAQASGSHGGWVRCGRGQHPGHGLRSYGEGWLAQPHSCLMRCLPQRGSLQIAADNAVFGQTGPKVGSFDAGYGSAHLARIVGTPPAHSHCLCTAGA